MDEDEIIKEMLSQDPIVVGCIADPFDKVAQILVDKGDLDRKFIVPANVLELIARK